MNARDWTGFGESYNNNISEVVEKGTETDGKITKKTEKITTTEKKLQPAKTLWDWMVLLLAPATLASFGFLFQSSQERAKRDKEEADKKRDADQQREQALQTYFDQLSELLVDKQLLKKSTNSETEAAPDKPASRIDADAALGVVKAKTLTLFRLFDNAVPTDIPRKSSVLAFLGDTELLNVLDLDLQFSHWENANLRRANLSGADLSGADLSDADLSFAKLGGAKLERANLTNANLTNADLSFAKLERANLSGADLSGADLSDAKLSFAKLGGAKLGGAKLERADLTNANLNNGKLRGADLRHAILTNGKLRGADLSDADLSNADLSNANLSNANLGGAILINANLRVVGLIQEQLEGEAQPFLCKVELPKEVKINPDRDCEKLPEILSKQRFRQLVRAVRKYQR
ncbi:MAG: pentapeptide repeat-containing protein [Phormidium tanganyikae FI6-MK23]|nr:pentapeptide repeat-containing protein [Phormidium tanganyikae FI6-MK23]